VVGRAVVEEAVAEWVVLDGKAEAVFDELDVAEDGAAGGFEFGSERGGGGAGAGFDALVDEEEAFPVNFRFLIFDLGMGESFVDGRKT